MPGRRAPGRIGDRAAGQVDLFQVQVGEPGGPGAFAVADKKDGDAGLPVRRGLEDEAPDSRSDPATDPEPDPLRLQPLSSAIPPTAGGPEPRAGSARPILKSHAAPFEN